MEPLDLELECRYNANDLGVVSLSVVGVFPNPERLYGFSYKYNGKTSKDLFMDILMYLGILRLCNTINHRIKK